MARGFRLQILITHKCNARCDHCDKAVGYANFVDMNDFTPEMMQEAVDVCKRERNWITRCTLSGGEPILNPHYQELLDIAATFPGVREGRLLTNDMPVTKARRDKIIIPNDKWHWVPAPLDDPTNFQSGKNKPGVRVRNRVHHPYFVSPHDLGVEAKWEWCGIKGWCGRGLDSKGWSMCGQAPILGRLLGIDPYPKSSSVRIGHHVNQPVPDICKHCYYGMKKGVAGKIFKSYKAGIVPAVTPTFERAFEEYEEFAKVTSPAPTPVSELVQIKAPLVAT